MKLMVHNLKLALDGNMDELKKSASQKIKIKAEDIKSFRIVKESVDARKKPDINFVYSVLIETDSSINHLKCSDVKILEDPVEEPLIPGNMK